MKILILSDIHANWPALAAVLAAEPVFDRVVCLGDLVNYGPHPVECVAWAQALVARGFIVRGNHDHAVGLREPPRCSQPFQRLAAATHDYTLSVLSATASVYLASLPVLHRVQMGNAAWVLCHAVPSDPLFEYVPPHSRSRWVREWEEIGRPQVLAVGHTHLPFVHHVGSGVVLNPGSVGQPKDGDPRAAYAVWNDGVVELKRAAYDIDAVARDLTDRFPPHVALPLAGVLHTGGQLPEAGTE